MFSNALLRAGHFVEGLKEIRRAIRLSPICPLWYIVCLGAHHFALSEYGQAAEAFRAFFQRADPDAPNNSDLRVWLAVSLMGAGLVAEATDAYRAVVEHYPEFEVDRWGNLAPNDPRVGQRARQLWKELAGKQ
tara:strand:+ start:219 stop:617 length:399 start_codon:yes stop_codon:yes gene_type:complete